MRTMLGLILVTSLAGCAQLPGYHKNMKVDLNAQNQSNESGTATLTAMGEQTKVEIDLSNAPSGTPQPAHIHEGTCDNLAPKPKWPLSSVKNGKSSTTVPVSLDKLRSGQYAINVHKSADDLKTYVACGNIK